MTLLLLTTALAAPPLPTWDDTHVEPLPEVEAEPETETHPLAPARPATGVRAFEDNDLAQASPWVDEHDLVFSLSGDVGKLYYVMGTVRAPGLVAHWRQGPFAGENRSVDLAVQLPAELQAPLAEVGTAYVSLRLAITTLDGRDLAQQRLAHTHIALEGSRPVGGIEVHADDIIADADLDLQLDDAIEGAPR